MPRRVDVTFELPDEVAPNLRDEDLAVKAKEALTMELLREHEISQGKAAELLAIDRHKLFDLMTKYRVPVIDMTPEELTEELKTPFPQSEDTNA
jgi:predicted HTH domain antitoxin